MATIITSRDAMTGTLSGNGCAPVPDLTGTAPHARTVDTSELEALFAEFNAGVERARRGSLETRP